MSDPLLTSLCGICRAVPPRYRCPRCGIRYCSVECSRRHRARAGCSGIRDVTAYVSRADLCTPAGVDHDYNFLRGIELARARNERHLVDERRLLRSGDLRPPVLGEDDQHRGSGSSGRGTRGSTRGNARGGGGRGRGAGSPMVLQKEWHGDELRFVPVVSDRRSAAAQVVHGGGGGGGVGGPSKKVRALCRRDGIELLGVPAGLARQRENNTTVATLMPGRAVQGQGQGQDQDQDVHVHLHWQVEWLVYEDGLAAKPTRLLRRLLDHVPLCRGYAALMAWVLQQTGVADDEGGENGESDDDDDGGRPKLRPRKRPMHPQQQQQPSKKRRTGGPAGQGHVGARAAGFSTTYAWQDPNTGVWGDRAEGDADDEQDGPDEADDVAAARRSLRFFLLRPRLPGDSRGADPAGVKMAAGKELIPLSPGDTLAAALAGRAVLEFPTVYVLPRGAAADGDEALPPGHIVGSTARRAVVDGGDGGDGGSSTAGMRAARQRHGPGGGRGGAAALDSETSSSGTSSSEDDNDDDDDDDEDDEDEDDETAKTADLDMDDGGDGLPLLRGLHGSKPKLVVYDSWSEGSADEGGDKTARNKGRTVGVGGT